MTSNINAANCRALAKRLLECESPENEANAQSLAAAGLDVYWQEVYLHPCGTPACIAGHAAYMDAMERGVAMPEPVGKEDMEDIWDAAQSWLGLESIQAAHLFHATPLGCFRSPSNLEAAAVLNRLADTGKVKWRKIENAQK